MPADTDGGEQIQYTLEMGKEQLRNTRTLEWKETEACAKRGKATRREMKQKLERRRSS